MNTTVDPRMLSEAQLNSVYQYAINLCQDHHDAYDLLQSALEKYLTAINQQEKVINNPIAYVRSMIRNQFIDQYRYQQRWQTESFEEFSSHDISPVSLEDFIVDSDLLQKIWSQISPQVRDILYHWAILGHSTDEACQILDMPRGTFLSHIHRLRQQLQHPTTSTTQEQEGQQ